MTSSFASFAEWVNKTDAPHAILQQRFSSCGEFAITSSILEEAFPDPATPDLAVIIVVDSSAKEPTTVSFGFDRFIYKTRPGSIVVNAPGKEAYYHGPGPHHLIALSMPWQRLAPKIAEVVDQEMLHMPPLVHSSAFFDATIEDCLLALAGHCRTSGTRDTLLFDERVNTILFRLLANGGVRIPDLTERSRLSKTKLGRVLELIDHSTEQTISLDDLADEAGCSRFHFSRLFKASTGRSPIEFVTRQRVAKARSKLRESKEANLASIAHECGFADQSHMGRHFKRIVGTTPKIWRDEQ